MQYKIINTGDYLLIVDDSEIKKETYCYDSINNILVFYKGSMKNIGFQKVISHLPLNNSPILEGADLLPPLEDEVEKIAEKEIPYSSSTTLNVQRMRFIHGYNKAKEKYKYTEKQLDDAISWATTKAREGIITHWDIDNFIQSIQQPKMPVGFKCEMVHETWGIEGIFSKTKTITNSQGLTQWVGEYIY